MSWADPATSGNLPDLVRAAAARTPDEPALVSAQAQLSWRELDARVDAAAAGLLAHGLSAGDRVAVVLGNCRTAPCWARSARARSARSS